jgi:hypothetical protein
LCVEKQNKNKATCFVCNLIKHRKEHYGQRSEQQIVKRQHPSVEPVNKEKQSIQHKSNQLPLFNNKQKISTLLTA